MAKNTGRGSRVATSSQSSSTTSVNMWTRRSETTGRFIRAKTNGGAFGGKKS